MSCRGCGSPVTGRKQYCDEACRSRYRRSQKGAPSSSLGTIAELLEKNDISIDDIGAIKEAKVSEWGNGNKSTSIVFSPKWEDGPEWPVVTQAQPVRVSVPKRAVKSRDWKVAVVLPDPQIGFRQTEDGLDPFHDEQAISVAMQLVEELRPDKIVNLGDLLDFPAHSRFAQEQAFATTTQHALDRAHRFLAEQRALCPKADIELHAGNHDVRLGNQIRDNAAASLHIRQANIPDSWPVMSVPFLLRLDELGIKYIDGYPAGESWINDRLVCRHAPAKMRSAGSSAAASIEDERVSTIFGHIHRLEMLHKTRPKRDGFTQNFAASVGCLCRIDGAVPSVNGAVDTKGNPVLTYKENWQHGLGVVTYQDGDADFALEIVPIISGKALFRGREFVA